MSVCPSCPPQRLKAGIVEAEKMAVVRQRLGKHVPVAMNTHNNRRTVGRGVCYVVHVVSSAQYVVKGK
jgi:hypothetical protein